MEGEKVVQHESFGMVGFSRIHAGGKKGVRLFGSSVDNNTVIALRIKRAEKGWHLHRHWYHANEQLIEVYMTPAQFAEAITGMNMGEGVPCTIQYIKGEGHMAECPDENVRELIEEDFREDMIELNSDISRAIRDAKDALGKKSISKGDLKAVIASLSKIEMDLNSNIPFIQSQFNEAMDKTVHEAKVEVDAFMTHTIVELGKDALARLKEQGPGPILMRYDTKSFEPTWPDVYDTKEE